MKLHDFLTSCVQLIFGPFTCSSGDQCQPLVANRDDELPSDQLMSHSHQSLQKSVWPLAISYCAG